MADQAINELSTKTAPETSDQLLLVGTGEPQLIDYDKLADAILNKITSKNYALDAGQMTLLAALNKLNSDSFSTYGTDNGSQASLPVKKGGATVMIAYALGGYGNDGSITVMALFRYNYEGTECSMDYIYNRGNTIIENSISNNKNTIAFKAQNGSPISYLKIKIFNM